MGLPVFHINVYSQLIFALVNGIRYVLSPKVLEDKAVNQWGASDSVKITAGGVYVLT